LIEPCKAGTSMAAFGSAPGRALFDRNDLVLAFFEGESGSLAGDLARRPTSVAPPFAAFPTNGGLPAGPWVRRGVPASLVARTPAAGPSALVFPRTADGEQYQRHEVNPLHVGLYDLSFGVCQ